MTTNTETAAEKPKRIPRIWVLKSGGVKVVDDAGNTTIVSLLPREMRKLGNILQYQATEIDKQQPSRIYATAVDD